MIRYLLILASILTLGACSGPKKTVATADPVAPAIAPIRAATSLPPLPESHINVPVKIVMKSFLDQAAVLIPKEVTSTGWPAYMRSSCDYQYKYRFIPGGFTFNCVNNQVQVKLSGTYQVAGEKCVCAFGKQTTPWIGGSCGFGNEPMRKTEIFIASNLQFLPNYTVHTKTAVQRVNALEKCTVTLFGMDITTQIADSIKASTNLFCQAMDSVVNGLDFSTTTRSLADRINKKIGLGRYGWLKINPSQVKIGRMNYLRDTLQAVMGISCFPELHSDSTNNFSASFLPPLQNANVQAGAVIYTNANYQYGFINSLINQIVKDTSFEVEGKTVILKNVRLNGADDGKLEMTVDFAGDKKGTLYLIGTPQLDTAKQVISLPDLDYTLKSRDLVLNLGKTFFSNRILRSLRDKANIKISELVEQNRKSIDAQLNKQLMTGVTTTGSLIDLKVIAVVAGKEALQAQTCARARASVVITELDAGKN